MPTTHTPESLHDELLDVEFDTLRDRLLDDRGLDDAPAKLLWIAAGVAIAIAAVAFAINVFDQTKEDYQDPVVPAVDGDL
ncbi:MAG: hypothetical protein AAFP84_17840 [Actinomycetota bacterium]